MNKNKVCIQVYPLEFMSWEEFKSFEEGRITSTSCINYSYYQGTIYSACPVFVSDRGRVALAMMQEEFTFTEEGYKDMIKWSSKQRYLLISKLSGNIL